MVREDKYNLMMLITHALTEWKRIKIWINSNLQLKNKNSKTSGQNPSAQVSVAKGTL